MSLMGALYVGSSGLRTGQNALNTTAHNMANADTPGYVRQQVMQGTREYTTIEFKNRGISSNQVGLGVNYTAVKHVRDYFLDKTYREDVGRASFYEVAYGATSETENILGEFTGTAFKESIDDLWTSVQELYKKPEDKTSQAQFVQRSVVFVQRAQSVYQGLSDYQDNLNLQVKGVVDRINQCAEGINQLNQQIRSIEAGGIERANDLRDVRDLLLDELGTYGKITCEEDIYGSVTVRFEDETLVAEDAVYEMGIKQDDVTGFYTPFWLQNARYTDNADGIREYHIENAKVFDLSKEISSSMETDIGKLKSLVLARGDHRGNYTDLGNAEVYNNGVAKSVIMNVQAEFDQLVNAIAKGINDILAKASDQTPDGYLSDADGNPLQLFQRIHGNAWDAPEEPGKTDTYFSVMNILVNPDIVRTPNLLNFKKIEDSNDYDAVAEMKKLFDEEKYSLNPNVIKKSKIADYYSDLLVQVGNAGAVWRGIMSNQQETVEITENRRQQVIGVSSDEELSNMIRFQNAYNASSRYINAISELLEHIINKLA